MRQVSLLKYAMVAATMALAPAPITAASAQTAATAPAKYSTATTQLGVLLADPAAKAVLVKYIPKLISSPDVADRASGMTLVEVQGALKTYSPDALPDSVLAQIDADLAKLPVKN